EDDHLVRAADDHEAPRDGRKEADDDRPRDPSDENPDDRFHVDLPFQNAFGCFQSLHGAGATSATPSLTRRTTTRLLAPRSSAGRARARISTSWSRSRTRIFPSRSSRRASTTSPSAPRSSSAAVSAPADSRCRRRKSQAAAPPTK